MKNPYRSTLWIVGAVLGRSGYSFTAQIGDHPVFRTPRHHIPFLEIRHKDRVVMHYDRGWIIPPSTRQHRAVVREAIAACKLSPEREQRALKRFLGSFKTDRLQGRDTEPDLER